MPPEVAEAFVVAFVFAAPLFVGVFIVTPLLTGAFVLTPLVTGACVGTPFLTGDCALTPLLTAPSLGIETTITQMKSTEIGFRNCRNIFLNCLFGISYETQYTFCVFCLSYFFLNILRFVTFPIYCYIVSSFCCFVFISIRKLKSFFVCFYNFPPNQWHHRTKTLTDFLVDTLLREFEYFYKVGQKVI